MDPQRRPPHGGRGLKFLARYQNGDVDASPPARGARIEISGLGSAATINQVAPRTGGAD